MDKVSHNSNSGSATRKKLWSTPRARVANIKELTQGPGVAISDGPNNGKS